MVKQSAEAPDVFPEIFPFLPDDSFHIRNQIAVVLISVYPFLRPPNAGAMFRYSRI